MKALVILVTFAFVAATGCRSVSGYSNYEVKFRDANQVGIAVYDTAVEVPRRDNFVVRRPKGRATTLAPAGAPASDINYWLVRGREYVRASRGSDKLNLDRVECNTERGPCSLLNSYTIVKSGVLLGRGWFDAGQLATAKPESVMVMYPRAVVGHRMESHRVRYVGKGVTTEYENGQQFELVQPTLIASKWSNVQQITAMEHGNKALHWTGYIVSWIAGSAMAVTGLSMARGAINGETYSLDSPILLVFAASTLVTIPSYVLASRNKDWRVSVYGQAKGEKWPP